MKVDADVKDLHRLGYAQLLLRDMGGFASFAISFSIISIITGSAGLFGYGLVRSGPLGVLAGWALGSIFALAMAASMAEIASAIPTAGAMYHWSTFVGNRAWGWFTAWFNIVGQYAITAGIDYSMAQFIAPLMGLNDKSRLVLLSLTAAIIVSHGLFSHFGIRLCAALNDVSAWYHIVLVLLIVGGVVCYAPHAPWSQLWSTQHTAKGPPVWLFMLSLLPVMWIYTGYDASAHISEETHLPRVNAPWGIYNAVAVSGIFGWLLLVALILGIKDLTKVSETTAMMDSLTSAFGNSLGVIVSWLVAGAMWFCGLSSLVSAGRTVYAFARDRGMPGSQWWGTVSPRWRTPVYATWHVVAVAFLLTVFVTQFQPDLSVIVTTATNAMYISYGLPVLLRLWARARGTWRAEFEGPWNLGRWSTPVNLAAVGWMLFSSVLFVAPPNLLAGVIFAGVIVALLFYWFVLGENRRFAGPQAVGTEEQLFAMEQQVEQQSFWHAEEEAANAG